MFIGRNSELSSLNRQYEKGDFQFFAIYGRRRVGKTSLINEFCQGKNFIFFSATESTYEENLEELIEQIMSVVPVRKPITSFKEALDVVFDYSKENQIIMVIDEYPYFAKTNEGVSSLLQHAIDKNEHGSKMFLILCGSSMSFMENQVMAYKSPLYGRRTGQLKMFPLDFYTSCLFVPNYTKEEQAVVYGVTGGIPKYLNLFDDKLTLDENLINNFFLTSSLLFEEPENLLKQELREPNVYNAMITAIANGSSEVNKIAAKTHNENSKTATYLKTLVDLLIVKKEIPFMDKETSRKTIYRINDGMFRFWYRFVYKNISMVQLGRGERVFRQIKPQIPDFMGEAFEQICKDYMLRENDSSSLAFEFKDIGRWWGNNPIKKCEQEIDLIATDWNDDKAMFCECKWTNEKVSESVIDGLIDKTEMFRFEDKYIYVFSKSGFTEAALKRAGRDVKLIEFKVM